MRVQHAADLRPSTIDLRVNRPLPDARARICRAVNPLAVEVDDDQVFRRDAHPTHRPGFDENSCVIQLCTEMPAETVTSRFRKIQNSACLDEILVNVHTHISASMSSRQPSSNATSRLSIVEADRTQ